MGVTVRLLEDTLVDQIAAGEVIERPASLVKELLENAVDAGAGSITVRVEDGGRGLVRVVDDGIGMSSADAALCIERHATSKIASFEDLVTVGTLGFRGEALPSIGAVSRMSITTRTAQDVEGTRVVVEGGEVRSIGPHGCPQGTTVEVEDLFYNVPARRKFLRARQTETSKIFEICQRTAAIRPDLRLVVTSEGRVAREYLPAGTLTERAYQVFGEVPLEEIQVRRDGIALEAALAPIDLARPGPRQLLLFVNGRPVLDRRLARAIAFAYGDAMAPGHYPRGVVSLVLPPEDVDVNAHPQKTEVRFKHASRVVDSVTRMLGGRLGTQRGAGVSQEHPAHASEGSTGRDSSDISHVAEIPTAYPAAPPRRLRLLAQLRERYLLCESHDCLYVLDRAAAEAEVRHRSLQRALDRGPLVPQALLFPDRLELNVPDRAVLTAHATLLTELGFDWSTLGEGTIALRAVPTEIGSVSTRRVFLLAIEVLRDHVSDARGAALRALAEGSTIPPGEPMERGSALEIVSELGRASVPPSEIIVGELALDGEPRSVEP